MKKVEKTDEQWKRELAPGLYRVAREGATETAFSGKLYREKRSGTYVCAACGNELFSSETKFDSGSGWPSFTDPVNREHVALHEDTSHGLARTEVTCAACGAHLGHVFPDGPDTMPDGTPASGNRYCINSISLDFKKDGRV